MSVKTYADDQRDAALLHVQKALECLSKIIIDQCEGYEEYSSSYKSRLRLAYSQLIEAREGLL